MPTGSQHIRLQTSFAVERDQLTGWQRRATARETLDDNADLPLADDDESQRDTGQHKQRDSNRADHEDRNE